MSDSYLPDNEPRYILSSLEELAAKKLPHAPTFRKAADEITRLRADLAAVTEERDALAARLAPVEDEELVEIVANVLQRGSQLEWSVLPEEWKNDWRRDARVAIAAIRPHIEAAERERCAKELTEACELLHKLTAIIPGNDGAGEEVAKFLRDAAIRRST